MKIFQTIIAISVLITLISSCKKEQNEVDKEKPRISMSFQDAFPINCDTLYFGEPFYFKAQLSDNVELGSFSIDIHHNFDHHSHSTDVSACDLDPIKTPINPFVFIQDFSISENIKFYLTNTSITIPEGNSNGIFDEGDYHFFISLTDKEGWSAQRGMSIKLLKR